MNVFQASDTLHRLPEQFFAKLTRKVADLKAAGHDVINLGQGNPDQPTPGPIVEAMQQAAAKPIHHQYSPFRGHPFLKQAIATFYEHEYGVKLDPESEVAILFGAKAGLVEASQCLLNPGDLALMPDPGYPDYHSGIAIAGARMAMMPLRYQKAFLPDYNELSAHTLEQAKMMFLNYPNNPTGAAANLNFFKDTVEMAARHNICVIHDFAYGGIGFDGQKPTSFLQAPGAKEVGVEMYTLSKTYNMAGWRVGFALGHPQVIEYLNLIQDHYYCSLFGAVQEAAAAALLGPQDGVAELARMYEARRNTFIGGLRSLGWQVQAPAGSFFTWLPVPDGWGSEALAEYLLDEADIAVAAGAGFGEQGEGYIRAGLLADEARLLEAVERIRQLDLF